VFDRRVVDVEAAGVGAEGGEDQAPAVGNEAAAADAAVADRDRGFRMVMPRNLALGPALRLVPEQQVAAVEFRGADAAETVRRRRVVVAGDPDPVMRGGQAAERRRIVVGQPVCRLRIVKAVAETDDPARAVPPQNLRQPPQGFAPWKSTAATRRSVTDALPSRPR
jgi:hypothetical protein